MLVVRALVVTIVTCGVFAYLRDQAFHRISHSGRISMCDCGSGERARSQVLGFCKISFNTLGKFSLTFSGHRRMGLRSIDSPDSAQFYGFAIRRLRNSCSTRNGLSKIHRIWILLGSRRFSKIFINRFTFFLFQKKHVQLHQKKKSCLPTIDEGNDDNDIAAAAATPAQVAVVYFIAYIFQIDFTRKTIQWNKKIDAFFSSSYWCSHVRVRSVKKTGTHASILILLPWK